MAAGREQSDTEQFLASIATDDRSRRIARGVLQELQAVMATERFPVHGNDDVWKTYGLTDDDLDEIILKVLRSEGCELPSRKSIMQQRPINTVADVVRYVDWICRGDRSGVS